VFAWISILGIIGLILLVIVAFGPKAPYTKLKATGNIKDKLSDFQLALRQPVTYIGALIFICGSWILQAFNDLSPAFLAVAPPIGVGLGPVLAGTIMVANIFGGMIAAASSGFLMKKVTNMQAKPIIITGFICAAIFTYSISLSFINSHMPALVIILLLAGLNGLTMPCCVAFIALCYPPSITGRIEGIWQGIGIFGGSFGVFAGAAALSATGNYNMSFVIVSAVAIIAVIISLFINPSKAFCVNQEGRVVRSDEAV
jgi:cyanate permease